MRLSETIEARLSQMPQSPLTNAIHGPCMNCSFTRELLIPFYQQLFELMSPETYVMLDQAVMRHEGITTYDHFLPRYGLSTENFLDTYQNAFWCFKVEVFLAALREVLRDETNSASELTESAALPTT